MDSEKNTNFDQNEESFSQDSNQSIEIHSKPSAELERLVVGHEEVQRRLTDPESNPENLLDNNELRLLKLSPEDELEYRRIRSQLLEKSSGSGINHKDLKRVQEFADKNKLEQEFRRSCQPLIDEYEKFSVATGTTLSMAEWIKTIDPGGFVLGDYNIGLQNFMPKAGLVKVDYAKPSFFKKVANFFAGSPRRALGDGISDDTYTREADLLQTLKTEIFEIEYFQHSNNWKHFLEEVIRENDKFIDELIST